MLKLLSLLLVSSSFVFGAPGVLAAQTCPSSGLDVSDQWITVTSDCTVQGNITLRGSSVLIVTDSRFVLRGNLTARDRAFVYVQRGEFIMDNRVPSEWGISMSGDALLWFYRTVFRSTTKTDSNYFMAVSASDTSKLWVTESSLPSTNSWLLARIVNSAQVSMWGSTNFPSEIFVEEQATARMEGGSHTALWMPFDSGSRATLVLPDQTTGPYSFEFGRRTPGVVGIGYDVVIANSQVRLGVNSKPGSQLKVEGKGRGHGPSGSGEIAIGYSISGAFGPETISGLRSGYQAETHLTHQGRSLTLSNVELDPVGWSVWVFLSLGLVTIQDSVLNEVAVWLGNVEVRQSILQWAALGSMGLGSSLVVRDSDISSQLIFGDFWGRVEVHDSIVHGSPLAARDFGTVRVSGGLVTTSGSVLPCDLQSGLTSSGVPLCNPFVAPGVLPSITTAGNGQVTIDGPPPEAVSDLHVVGWSEPQPVNVGGLITYHAQIGNQGPDPATGVSLRFKAPSQATVEGFSPGCTVEETDVICSVGNLPVFGGSQWFSVAYRVVSTLTPAVGEVSVTSDQFDPDSANHILRLTNNVIP